MPDETESNKATEDEKETEQTVKKESAPQAELEKRIEELENEVAEYQDRYLRAAAELRNYRKRVADQRAQQLQYAHEQLVTALLPVLDHMELALQSAQSKDESPEEILAGVEMIYRQLQDVLGQFGVKRVEAVGEQFDARIHEAVERRVVKDDAVANGEIIEEFRPGYKIHDRVVRPARVCVCVKQEDVGEENADEEQTDE